MGDVASELSEFQTLLEKRLEDELISIDKKLVNRVVEGERERYIAADIYSSNIKLWIYKDGAEFTDLGKIDCRYEAVDYDSMESLIQEYVADLLGMLKEEKPALRGQIEW